MNIYQKLAQVRKSIPVLYKKYSEALKTKVMSSEDLLQEINEHINNAGLFLVTEQAAEPTLTKHIETKQKWDNYAKKELTYNSVTYEVNVRLKYTWVNVDKPDEIVSVNWYCSAINQQGDPAKAIGAALTYSEKYFFLKFFNIETSKDDPDFKKVEETKQENKPKEQLKTETKTKPEQKQQVKVSTSPDGKIFDSETKSKLEKQILSKKYNNIKEWSDSMQSLDKYYKDKGFTSLLDLAWFEEAFNQVKPESEG